MFGILFLQVIALATQVRVSDAGGFTGDPNISGRSSSTRLIRVWAVAVISPFQKLSVNSGSGVRNLWGKYVGLIHVRDENARLQEQLNELRLQQTRLQQDADQGRRLQALLAFKEQYVEKTIAAQVIGTSGTDLSRVIYIDRGYRDGVEAGMAVITPDGIVGKISRADRSTSQVLLITDQLSGAGVLLERLRLNGILKGTQSGSPEVLNVMADEKIEVGDKVITTGGDRVYPKGLAVGTVINVAPDRERDPFLSIRVKPAVNLGHLEEVLVVTQLSERSNAVADATVPIRAADMLAQRLPSAKKKTEEDGKKTESPEQSGAKPLTNETTNTTSPKPVAKAVSQPSKPAEKTKESPR
ncbi:MAG: rod shape-determining protein MreC [Acidobacteriales bacterium]|nr:rod shape-determining protein MreC [Terriglobales bacterium]